MAQIESYHFVHGKRNLGTSPLYTLHTTPTKRHSKTFSPLKSKSDTINARDYLTHLVFVSKLRFFPIEFLSSSTLPESFVSVENESQDDCRCNCTLLPSLGVGGDLERVSGGPEGFFFSFYLSFIAGEADTSRGPLFRVLSRSE